MQRDRSLRRQRAQRASLATRRAEEIVGNDFDDVDPIEIREYPERQRRSPTESESITHVHDQPPQPPQPPPQPPPHELPQELPHELPQEELPHELDVCCARGNNLLAYVNPSPCRAPTPNTAASIIGSAVAPPGTRNISRSRNPPYRLCTCRIIIFPLSVNRGNETLAAIPMTIIVSMIRNPTFVRPASSAISTFVNATPLSKDAAITSRKVRAWVTFSLGRSSTRSRVSPYASHAFSNPLSSNIHDTSPARMYFF